MNGYSIWYVYIVLNIVLKYVKKNLVPKKFSEIPWGEVKIDALKG